jgi:thiamine-monophosphate kinase
MINEQKLIEQLTANSLGYIGDDAATLPNLEHGNYIISKDLLVEKIHFQTDLFSPEDLAHKVLHSNLSDLAAMGAKTKFVLCGISIPDNLAEYSESFLTYLMDYCKRYHVILIGGDTTAAKNDLTISITAIGEAGNIIYRDTASPSEIICVAGNLGYAHLGSLGEVYQSYFLRPQARMGEGIWLSQQSSVTAMMDISDGLLIDLSRLCSASSVAGFIELDNLQLNDLFINECKHLSTEPQEVALIGGEDYSLLFMIKSNSYCLLKELFHTQFGYSLKRVGHTKSGSGIHCLKNGTPVKINYTPFTHFGESIEL